jgi:hypothetical protein
MTERTLHKSVADLLASVLAPEVAWTTFPAGGGGLIRGAQLKKCGLKPGWPDLQLIYRGRYFGIELKVPGNSLDKEQRVAHAEITSAGGNLAVCKSLNEVSRQLEAWGIPTKRYSISLESRVRAAGMQ